MDIHNIIFQIPNYLSEVVLPTFRTFCLNQGFAFAFSLLRNLKRQNKKSQKAQTQKTLFCNLCVESGNSTHRI